MTACCACIDGAGRRMRLALAGHEPPMLRGPDAQTRLLDREGGLPLGMFPDQCYEEQEIDMSPGDFLLFCTDGITDTRNARGEHFGVERVIECLRATGDESAAELLDRLFAEADAFRGEVAWVDDLTALTLHCQTRGCE